MMSFFLDDGEENVQLLPDKAKSKTLPQEIAGLPVKTTVTVTPIEEEELEKGCQDYIVRPIETFSSVTGPEVLEGAKGAEQMMGGMKFIVEYYSQYLAKDGVPQHHSIDTLFGFQQYRRIVKYILRLDSAPSFNYDATTGQGEQMGTGKMPGGIIPNVGDCFIGEVGDGRLALWTIYEVRPLTHLKGTAHEISFKVKDYLTEEVKKDLLDKTIDTYLYNGEGVNGLVPQEEVHQLGELELILHQLTESYFRWFYDTETASFTVPIGIGKKVHDVFQAKFIDRLIDKQLYQKYRQVKLQRIDMPNKVRQISIWDALIERDWMVMEDSATYFNFILTSRLKGGRFQFNSSHSRYGYIIYPYYLDGDTPMGIRDISGYTAPAEMPLFEPEDPTINRRWIYHIRSDEDYVFSKYFYLKDQENMSVIERLVWCYLDGKSPCLDRLMQLLRASYRWDDLDRYYYIPVLILLGRVKLQGG